MPNTTRRGAMKRESAADAAVVAVAVATAADGSRCSLAPRLLRHGAAHRPVDRVDHFGAADFDVLLPVVLDRNVAAGPIDLRGMVFGILLGCRSAARAQRDCE